MQLHMALSEPLRWRDRRLDCGPDRPPERRPRRRRGGVRASRRGAAAGRPDGRRRPADNGRCEPGAGRCRRPVDSASAGPVRADRRRRRRVGLRRRARGRPGSSEEFAERVFGQLGAHVENWERARRSKRRPVTARTRATQPQPRPRRHLCGRLRARAVLPVAPASRVRRPFDADRGPLPMRRLDLSGAGAERGLGSHRRDARHLRGRTTRASRAPASPRRLARQSQSTSARRSASPGPKSENISRYCPPLAAIPPAWVALHTYVAVGNDCVPEACSG